MIHPGNQSSCQKLSKSTCPNLDDSYFFCAYLVEAGRNVKYLPSVVANEATTAVDKLSDQRCQRWDTRKRLN